MKRLTFKKPFNGMDNALKLIPESYKVDGKEFQITDGTETYNIRWDINEATVLRAENKNLINEDMNKIKHLMGFKSQETLGNLKGEERVNENSSFTDVWNKTKSLLSESKEEVNEMISGSANGLGFTGEGNLEGNAPIAETEATEEEKTEEVVSEAGQAFGMGFTNEGNLEENEPINGTEEEGGPINVQDIRKDMKSQLYTLNKADFDAKERKVVDILLGLIQDLGKEGSAFSPRLMKLLGLVKNAIDSKLPKNEPVDSEDSTAEIAQDAMAANQNEGKDRFDEIFEDMYTEEEEEVKNPGKYKTGMKKGYDTDGDGVPDGADKDPYDGNIQEGK